MIILLAGLAVLALAAILLLPLADWLMALREFLEGLGTAGAVLFVIIMILATGTVAPAAPFSVAAGWMFGISGLPTAILAATAGASLAFSVSRRFLRGWMARSVARHARIEAFDRAVGEGGWRVVALIRLSPLIPFNIQSLSFGASRVGFRPFLGGTVIGITPNTAFYVYLGAAGRMNAGAGDPLRWALLGAGLAATLLAALLLTRAARRRMLAMMPQAVASQGEPR